MREDGKREMNLGLEEYLELGVERKEFLDVIFVYEEYFERDNDWINILSFVVY